MMVLWTVVSLWAGAVAAVLTPIVYGVGNRWWATYWGRTLFVKDLVIGLAYLRSIIGLLAAPRLPAQVPWISFATSVAMACALGANLVVMVVITQRGRRTPRPEPEQKKVTT